MPKRKAGSRKKQSDKDDAKKPRHADPASRASAADDDDPLAAALAHANLAQSVAVYTFKLIDAIQATEGSWKQRIQAVVDLLQADAARPASLLDLSLVPEGDKAKQQSHSRVWVQHDGVPHARTLLIVSLLYLCCAVLCCSEPGVCAVSAAAILPFRHQRGKDEGRQECSLQAHPHWTSAPVAETTALLRSGHHRRGDGQQRAARNVQTLFLQSVGGWDYQLAELLIARGVSVHQRNKEGRTPLLQRACSMGPRTKNANGLRLLLAHDADLNAQDSEGNGVLHHLVRKGELAELEDLLGGGGVSHLDHFLRNSAGQTAVDLAAIQLAQQADSSANSPVKRIHQLMAAQESIWTKRVRLALQLCLDEVLPVADLAKLALGYMDGSGLPFSSAAAVEEEEVDPEDDQPQQQ